MLRTILIYVVYAAVAIGAVLVGAAIVTSLRLRERTDRIPAAVQLGTVTLALASCVTVFADRSNAGRASLGVIGALIVYKIAARYSRWADDSRADASSRGSQTR
jgi:cadmium resistance protein CadD (predicted permease)